MPKRNPDGKRQTLRKYFNTEAEALFHMKAARAESEDWWQAYQYKITSLSEFQMNDAMRALEMLNKAFPEDTPRLAEVIHKYLESTDLTSSGLTIYEAVEKFKRWDGLLCRIDSHLTQFKRRTKRFAIAYDGKPLDEFTKQTIEEWKDHRSQTGLGEGGIRSELLCLNSPRRTGSLLCIGYVLCNQTGRN